MTKNHDKCEKCGSSDGVTTNPKTGIDKCFVCGTTSSSNNSELLHEAGLDREDYRDVRKDASDRSGFAPIADKFYDLNSRGISKASAEKYLIGTNFDQSKDIAYVYPIFKAGTHSGNKLRVRSTKDFRYEGDVKGAELFGQHAFPAASAKNITVVEGQDDAPAAYELMGSLYPCVSVHSSSTALQDVKNNYEYLDSFPEITLAFDNDEPGKKAALACAAVFKPGKVKILTLQKHKDANDYLRAGDHRVFVKEWWKAKPYRPDGIKMGTDMWDEIINRPNHFTVQYPWDGINRMTYGMRLSEAVIVTADTGVGKTSFITEIEHRLLTDPDVIEKGFGVGFLHLEEPNHDTALHLMSVHDSKPYHLPDVDKSEEDLRKAYDAVVNTDRVVIWDHFGSNSVDAVLDKVRHMHALGCKYIVLDHLSIVVSDQSGDERKQLDEISTKLKTLCMELNIALIAVIHQNRAGQIRGTAGVEQLANIVVKLSRDKTANDPWRRNVTKCVIEKNRFSGKSGPCLYLWYNDQTGRLVELDEEEVRQYEAGESPSDDERPW